MICTFDHSSLLSRPLACCVLKGRGAVERGVDLILANFQGSKGQLVTRTVTQKQKRPERLESTISGPSPGNPIGTEGRHAANPPSQDLKLPGISNLKNETLRPARLGESVSWCPADLSHLL